MPNNPDPGELIERFYASAPNREPRDPHETIAAGYDLASALEQQVARCTALESMFTGLAEDLERSASANHSETLTVVARRIRKIIGPK